MMLFFGVKYERKFFPTPRDQLKQKSLNFFCVFFGSSSSYTWRTVEAHVRSESDTIGGGAKPTAKHHFYHFTTTRSLIQSTRRDGLPSLLVANYEPIYDKTWNTYNYSLFAHRHRQRPFQVFPLDTMIITRCEKAFSPIESRLLVGGCIEWHWPPARRLATSFSSLTMHLLHYQYGKKAVPVKYHELIHRFDTKIPAINRVRHTKTKTIEKTNHLLEARTFWIRLHPRLASGRTRQSKKQAIYNMILDLRK